MKFVSFALVILLKCFTLNCDEDSTTSMGVSERLEKTNIFIEDYTLLEEKAGDVEDISNIEKTEGCDEKLYKLRTSSDFSLEEVTDIYNFSDLINTEDSVTEKIVKTQKAVETERDENDSTNKSELLRKSSEFLRNGNDKIRKIPKNNVLNKNVGLEEVTEFYNISDLISTEDFVTKNVVKQDRQEEEVTEKEEKYNLNNSEVSNKSSKFVQHENSETSEIPKAVLKIEERKPKESEASAERKLNVDIETLPFILEESDGKSDSNTVGIKKKSDNLNLDKPIATRKFFLSPNVALNTNTNSEDTSAKENSGLKIAPNIDFDQFASNSDRKLINPIFNHEESNNNKLTPAAFAKKASQIVIPFTNGELLNPYLTKIYLTYGFNLFSPLSEVLLQRQQRVPIYMKLKFDEILSRIYMVGIHNPHSSEAERRKDFDQENQQYERLEQNISLDHKDPENLRIEYIYNFKEQIKRIMDPKLSKDYIQFQNLKQKPKIQKLPKIVLIDTKNYPNNIQSHNLRFGDQVQSPTSKRFGNINQEKNHFQPFHHNQALASKVIKKSLDGTKNVVPYSKGRGNSEKSRERFTNSHSYMQSSNAPDSKIVGATKNYDPNSQSFKTLFHKLVQVSRQPRQFTSPNLYSAKKLSNYPYLSYFPNF